MQMFFSPEGLRSALPLGAALSSSSSTVPSSLNEGYVADVFAQARSPAFCLVFPPATNRG